MTVEHDELMAIIAHELGHIAGYHMFFLLTMNMTSIILPLVLFMAVESAGTDFYAAFGFNKV
jgi:Zn-dependent protease with chaperone function